MNEFLARRLAFNVGPASGDPLEAEGILNPASARGPDGELYLFPRDVAKGNYSRVGVARVLFSDDGEPAGIERLGVALEPMEPYERRPDGGGGCEDPRVTFVDPLGLYVMTYTAYSPGGPRIAIAVSENLRAWRRLGLVSFDPHDRLEFTGVDNKDAAFFPQVVSHPHGTGLAMLHRPFFYGTTPEELMEMGEDRSIDDKRECVWMSISRLMPGEGDLTQLTHFTDHHRLAVPEAPWERVKIGCGAPPLLTPHGWLLVYHGVGATVGPDGQTHLTYLAGVMMLATDDPMRIEYRSPDPVLVPTETEGPRGTPSNVVFPTGLDCRDDLGQPDRIDVYYGMNDFRMQAATITVPRILPATRAPSGADS
jgi:beta-1,2-mannobiose phosphorylase / 1,2-beta-oligomannan phosphorylase